jgi:transcriptional regulator with XRE-family HTH domain
MDAMSGKIRHLYYNRKKSYEEIADLLGISVDEVTKYLFGETFDTTKHKLLHFPSGKLKPWDCDGTSLTGFILLNNDLEKIKERIDLTDLESVKFLECFLHALYNEAEDPEVKDILAHRITLILTLLISEDYEGFKC